MTDLQSPLQKRYAVAVLRLDNIGDHILGSGFFRGLREQLPQAEITALVSKRTAQLYEVCPYINRCVHLPDITLKGQNHQRIQQKIAEVLAPLIGTFDLLVNPRVDWDYYNAGGVADILSAPRSVTFRQGDELFDSYHTDLIDRSDGLHMAEYAGLLLRKMFGSEDLFPPETWSHGIDSGVVHNKLLKMGWDGRTQLIILAPGASQLCRRWPPFRVMALIEGLVKAHRVQVVVLGDRAERRRYPLPRQIAQTRLIDMRGGLTISQLSECCRLATVFIGTDSGPKHIAAASGLQVIEINHLPISLTTQMRKSWPTGPLWAAYGVPTIQLQPNGDFSESQILEGVSIAAVTERQVLEAVAERLSRG
jgi:ADP-heptose:LPS heptosyltransferase